MFLTDWIFSLLDRARFLEGTIAVRLLELSNSLSTFHFSVQTPDGKAFLLVRETQNVFIKMDSSVIWEMERSDMAVLQLEELIDCRALSFPAFGYFKISYTRITTSVSLQNNSDTWLQYKRLQLSRIYFLPLEGEQNWLFHDAVLCCRACPCIIHSKSDSNHIFFND